MKLLPGTTSTLVLKDGEAVPGRGLSSPGEERALALGAASALAPAALLLLLVPGGAVPWLLFLAGRFPRSAYLGWSRVGPGAAALLVAGALTGLLLALAARVVLRAARPRHSHRFTLGARAGLVLGSLLLLGVPVILVKQAAGLPVAIGLCLWSTLVGTCVLGRPGEGTGAPPTLPGGSELESPPVPDRELPAVPTSPVDTAVAVGVTASTSLLATSACFVLPFAGQLLFATLPAAAPRVATLLARPWWALVAQPDALKLQLFLAWALAGVVALALAALPLAAIRAAARRLFPRVRPGILTAAVLAPLLWYGWKVAAYLAFCLVPQAGPWPAFLVTTGLAPLAAVLLAGLGCAPAAWVCYRLGSPTYGQEPTPTPLAKLTS